MTAVLLEKICVPVFGRNLEAFDEVIAELRGTSEFLEFRLDGLASLSEEVAVTLAARWEGKSVLTCRLPVDGGAYKADLSLRNQVLAAAFTSTASYVDVELERIEDSEFESLRAENGTNNKLLLSHHNFQETPSLGELERLLETMLKYEPAICKLALQVNQQGDLQRLYHLLCNHDYSASELIVVGMGPVGRPSRIVAPMLGSFLSYCEPRGLQQSALEQGPKLAQYKQKEMQEIFRAIGA